MISVYFSRHRIGLSEALRLKRKRSSALVATLVIMALLTIMVVGFVLLASQDLGATHSYTQSIRVQEIALSGLDKIVSQIQTEITDPNNNASLNGNGTSKMYMYVPNSSNAVPQRMVSSVLAPIVTESGKGVYGSVTDYSSAGNVTTTASLNNRSISISRWCKPQLLFPASTNAFVPPNWVILTRSGPKSFPAGSAPGNVGLTVSGLTNMNEAVGRYAYVVYDTSGLLDLTVAGYPSAATTNAVTKGILPWADLTQLNSAITTADVDKLVSWRNAANSSSYSSYVTNWEGNGFRQVAPGDTTFLSRQDLIDYVQNYNPDLTNALPYVTTFSRELNGPTWGPTANYGTVLGTNYNYQANATVSGSTNRLIYDVRVATGGWARQNGTTAVAGEPLVKYRFPLDKLALLEKPGTTGLSAQDTSDVLKYFGLVLATDSNGLYRHWIYTNPAGGTTPVGKILTLDAVAALNREPDFFELLKAGILSGSLGKGGVNCSWWNGLTDYDMNPDYQIIRIGANIIDQWTSDSYPTAIEFNVLITSSEAESCDFYGIKDLPYFNKVLIRANGSGSNVTVAGGVSLPGPPYDAYLYFELWNPHQQTASASTYPTAFRIAPLSENSSSPANARDYYQLGMASGTNPNGHVNTELGWNPPSPPGTGYWPIGYSPNWGNHGGYNAEPLDLTQNGGIVPLQVTPSSYRTPTIVPGAPGSSYTIANNGSPVGAMYLGRIPDPSSNVPTATPAVPVTGFPGWTGMPVNCIYYANCLILQLQYQDASGTWRTYGSFCGMPNNNIRNWQSAANCFGDSYIYIAPTTANAPLDSAAFMKSDPRTCRFGVGEMIRNGNTYNSGSAGASLTPSANNILSAQYVEAWQTPGATQSGPFWGTSGLNSITRAKPYRMDMWAVNATNTTPQGGGGVTFYSGTKAANGAVNSYYTDNDGVMRPGDAGYTYPNASPFFTGDTATQPIVLNHRFNSVADLGYAFRDSPWKTLDFSSPASADAGLLDLFTMSDAPIAAGRVNPNTAPIPVLNALLSGAQANISSTGVANSITNLAPSTASTIATQISNAAATTPFLNRAALAGYLSTNAVAASAIPSGIKVEKEAAMRALAESANTRTWNFLIDVIAQSGNYPQNAATLDSFNVTGERRYWLHVAVDRFTGQVVDKQLEVVNE